MPSKIGLKKWLKNLLMDQEQNQTFVLLRYKLILKYIAFLLTQKSN